MASQFNLQRSASLTRCAMRSLASLSRNRTSDAGKIGMISSTDYFNKIGPSRIQRDLRFRSAVEVLSGLDMLSQRFSGSDPKQKSPSSPPQVRISGHLFSR